MIASAYTYPCVDPLPQGVMNLTLQLRPGKRIFGHVSRTIGMRICITRSRVRHVH
jgi:hypothetical protein